MSQTSTNRNQPVALASGNALAIEQSIALLHQFTRDLIAPPDLNAILRQALVIAAQLTGAQHATLLLLDDAGEQIRYRIALNNGNLAPLELVAKPMMSKGLAGWVARNSATALVEDTEHDQRWLPGPGLGDLRSALVAPLMYADRLCGILTLGGESPGLFCSAHIPLIEIVAAQAAGAIQLARAAADAARPSVPHAAPRAQTVVALASKLRGLSTAAAQLAPDVCFDDVLGAYTRAMTQIVGRHHGMMVHADGAALLAVFETSHASTAASAALDMQTATQQLTTGWQRRLGMALRLPNVGLGLSTALLGRIDPGQASCTAVGPAVEQAQRLCELARGGEILVSDTILAALGDTTFTLAALPPLRLGANDTQQIYQLQPAQAGHTPASRTRSMS